MITYRHPALELHAIGSRIALIPAPWESVSVGDKRVYGLSICGYVVEGTSPATENKKQAPQFPLSVAGDGALTCFCEPLCPSELGS